MSKLLVGACLLTFVGTASAADLNMELYAKAAPKPHRHVSVRPKTHGNGKTLTPAAQPAALPPP